MPPTGPASTSPSGITSTKTFGSKPNIYDFSADLFYPKSLNLGLQKSLAYCFGSCHHTPSGGFSCASVASEYRTEDIRQNVIPLQTGLLPVKGALRPDERSALSFFQKMVTLFHYTFSSSHYSNVSGYFIFSITENLTGKDACFLHLAS